jgi:pilus assembly protein TadC
VTVLVYQNYQSLLKRYHAWQKEIQRDIPDLIDKLRISFASGRDYVSALIQVRASSGPKMARAIERLVSDIQSIGVARALDGFAAAFRMPVVNKLASAVRIAVESGYQSAETYFVNIESDLREVRQVAMEELTRSKPEKVYQLYLILSCLAIGTLCLKGWEIFSQITDLF